MAHCLVLLVTLGNVRLTPQHTLPSSPHSSHFNTYSLTTKNGSSSVMSSCGETMTFKPPPLSHAPLPEPHTAHPSQLPPQCKHATVPILHLHIILLPHYQNKHKSIVIIKNVNRKNNVIHIFFIQTLIMHYY